MAAKVRLVVSDQNSAELEALRRSYNSFLIVLQNIAFEQAAATTTATQAAQALSDALSTGVDSNNAPHVGTSRLVFGVRPTPNQPLHKAEKVTDLKPMLAADKY